MADGGAVTLAVTADVTAPDEGASVFATAKERHDRVDVLINNAGVITIRQGFIFTPHYAPASSVSSD